MHFRKKEMHELERLDQASAKRAERLPLVVALDSVRSMLNVGSVFRTCDAFMVQELLLLGITGTPPHREIQKTALGATETVPWRHYNNPQEGLSAFKEQGYRILAVEQAEPSMELGSLHFNPQEKMILVFGNEAFGVSDEVLGLCDGCLEIPQFGSKHSLNVAVSVGVVLWEFSRSLRGSA